MLSAPGTDVNHGQLRQRGTRARTRNQPEPVPSATGTCLRATAHKKRLCAPYGREGAVAAGHRPVVHEWKIPAGRQSPVPARQSTRASRCCCRSSKWAAATRFRRTWFAEPMAPACRYEGSGSADNGVASDQQAAEVSLAVQDSLAKPPAANGKPRACVP